jgi:nucleoside phosphorylase
MDARRFDEAEALLRGILDAEPRNNMALVNRTALYLRAARWEKAIEAVDQARPLLSGEDLKRVQLNEALAREQLGTAPGTASLPEALERLKEGASPAPPAPTETVVVAPSDPKMSTEPVKVAAPPDEGIDIAIVTALPPEYDAVLARLANVRDAPQAKGLLSNRFAWKVGEIPNHNGTGMYKVVLAQAPRSGNMDTLITVIRTIDRWNPDHILFSGIAGGLKREGLKQGDIVLSENIWFYDNGKMQVKYRPRHRVYPPHGGLFTSASEFGRNTQGWKNCGTTAPTADHTPNCLPGLIGSGDKVIDSLKPAFVKAILKARPEIRAVEMEAAGAGAAVQNAIEEGRAVKFMMVRGISDMPQGGADASGSGTEERDGWKPYACAIAAHFVVSWISSSAWPDPPRSSSS